MKKLVRIIALSALVATLWLPALALNTETVAASTAQQGDEEAKAALYTKFLEVYKTDAKAAAAVAREYLQKYPAESEQTAYLKRWITAYEAKEKEGRKASVEDLLRQQKYADAFNSAKAILADEPGDVRTLNNAVFAALYAAGVNKNETFNAEAANYARKSIQIIQSGQPFDKRDDTLGWLNSALGYFTLKTSPSEAVDYYIKAASFEGAAKKDPQTYLFLAEAYTTGDYKKLRSEVTARCTTAEQQATPECTALSDRVNQVVDRMIDAYARSIALATDPKYAALKADAMAAITPLFKFRNKDSDAGLSAYISGVLARPLPTGPITAGTSASTTPATSQTPTTGAAGAAATTPATTPNTGTTTGAATTGQRPTTTTPATTPKP